MKKKLLKILLFVTLVSLTVLYTYKVRILVDDELFNYGFAKNIIDGLIPYKDFNMIIPPLFAYITALVLKVFGQSLLVYHILTAVIITSITFMSAKKIGILSFIIYLLLLIYPYTGYNMFTLFLFFILLNTIKEESTNKKKKKEEKQNKLTEYLEPIIISLIILTKHTLGLLVIPSLIYSKNKLKTFLIYVGAFLVLLTYLLLNNNIMQFIDYTLLGMFDFAEKNGTGIDFLLIVEIAIIGYLIYLTKKTKKKEYFYILMYQIVTFPIVNYVHFIISFIPFVYIIISKYKNNFYVKWFSGVALITFAITFGVLLFRENKYFQPEYYNDNNFMKGRLTQKITIEGVELIDEYTSIYKEHKLYIFSYLGYYMKLNLDLPITKYDLINNGNMGYKGYDKYIEETEEYCKDNKCIFFITKQEVNEKGFQTNKKILKYVMGNYRNVYSTNFFNIYVN